MHLQPIDNTEIEPFASAMATDPRFTVVPEEQEIFDDVWGSEPGSPTNVPQHAPTGTHPGDIPRLQAEHTTAGYREGVTVAKAQSIQVGFDEGFSLGAELGSLAGQIVGILEGIAAALVGQDEAVVKAARKASDDAKMELRTDSIFAPAFWNTDGTWKFDVDEHAGEEILFSDVARAHPLIQKWTKVANAEVERWGIVLDAIGDAQEHERQPSPERAPSAAVPQTKKPLDW
ncbi:essential protein Yae1 [Colletotrichum navitas]|uniref:Protein YAE1 n=1 Tax=Colletotrichum navitas TaxID=681940 RepID=A0AAD8Q6H2_9PEZI|nr:essential protein Yae1 [Colletotrichum navitas]KAK1596820.1 essential protein Yae1 [Colletotrichum navitas]